MKSRYRRRGFYGGLFVLGLGSFALYCASLARSPDQVVEFSREVQSPLPAETLGRALHVLENWPRWHYNMLQARSIDARGVELGQYDQFAAPHALLHLKMEPPKKQWKRFELFGEVLEYRPNRLIRVRLSRDTSGRLTELFRPLEWTIELIPNEKGTRIRGTLRGRTAHWRARFFANFAGVTQRILMHQIFYPDLQKLADLSDPKDLVPPPQTHR